MRALWLPVLATALLLAGCGRPAEEPEAKLSFSTEPPAVEPVRAIVPIPEEFQTPRVAPVPATPPVLFVTKDFQITNRSGIRGIRAGEAVNLLRETADEYIVQYGDLEFIKEKEFFSATFAGRPAPADPAPQPNGQALDEPRFAGIEAAPEPSPLQTASLAPSLEPVAPEASDEVIGISEPVAAGQDMTLPSDPSDSGGLAAPLEPLPDEPPLADLPPPSAADKQLADLTDAIRDLNTQIRAAEDAGAAKKPTRTERRRLAELKEERDNLSRELTLIGKP